GGGAPPETPGRGRGGARRPAARRVTARRAREVAEAAAVLVLLHDDEHAELTVEVVEGFAPAKLAGVSLPADEGALAGLVQEQRHVTVEDLDKVTAWPTPTATGAAVIVPMAVGGHVLGALVVAHAAGSPQT